MARSTWVGVGLLVLSVGLFGAAVLTSEVRTSGHHDRAGHLVRTDRRLVRMDVPWAWLYFRSLRPPHYNGCSGRWEWYGEDILGQWCLGCIPYAVVGAWLVFRTPRPRSPRAAPSPPSDCQET